MTIGVTIKDAFKDVPYAVVPLETEYVKLTIDSTTKADCKDTCLTFVEPF